MKATCGSCSAPVVWAITAKKGRAIPIDPVPNESGNITLTQPDDPREPPIASMSPAGVRPPMPRYLSHFATCPNADAHRKAR